MYNLGVLGRWLVGAPPVSSVVITVYSRYSFIDQCFKFDYFWKQMQHGLDNFKDTVSLKKIMCYNKEVFINLVQFTKLNENLMSKANVFESFWLHQLCISL